MNSDNISGFSNMFSSHEGFEGFILSSRVGITLIDRNMAFLDFRASKEKKDNENCRNDSHKGVFLAFNKYFLNP